MGSLCSKSLLVAVVTAAVPAHTNLIVMQTALAVLAAAATATA